MPRHDVCTDPSRGTHHGEPCDMVAACPRLWDKTLVFHLLPIPISHPNHYPQPNPNRKPFFGIFRKIEARFRVPLRQGQEMKGRDAVERHTAPNRRTPAPHTCVCKI